jgi:hypothetical protein
MYTGVPLVLGGFFDVAMLVNRKGTVLSCSIGMSRIFGAWPGLSWSDLAIGSVGLTGTDPTTITFEELLGPLDLADPVDARRMRVYVKSVDKTRPFDLVIRGETDQILGRVIFVEFRAVSENGASQAPHAVLN